MKNSIATLGYLVLLYFGLLTTEKCHYAVAADISTLTPVQNFTPTSIKPPADDDDDFVPYQGERFNTFDWTLFRGMGKRYPGNLLLSPISVKLALVLLYEGAQDQTAHELAGALHLPPSRSATREKFSTALESLQAPSEAYTLNIGTRLYIDSNVMVRQRYGAIAKTFYAADVITRNLNDSQTVAAEVNTWVNNVTEGHIPMMIDDDNSIKDSVMLIMNALFFKGNWRRRYFQPENTKPGKFFTRENESVDVPFMHTISNFYYSESSELDAKILRIPYEGQKFAMYLILPFTVNGADLLLNQINPFILTRHVWLMQDLPVAVSIPKFKFEFSCHLETTLRELGIRDIFDNTATLTGIARTKRTSRHLQVTDILQKTGIEVNENGTSAYSAVEVQLGNKIEEETFHATHPFLFYIEDETTGTILYLGKIANPLEVVGRAETPVTDVPPRFGEETSVTG